MRDETMKHILVKTTILTWILAAPVALLGNAATPSAEPSTTYQADDQELFSKSFDIGPDGSLTLSNVSGDIQIRGSSGGQIEVRAVKEVRIVDFSCVSTCGR